MPGKIKKPKPAAKNKRERYLGLKRLPEGFSWFRAKAYEMVVSTAEAKRFIPGNWNFKSLAPAEPVPVESVPQAVRGFTKKTGKKVFGFFLKPVKEAAQLEDLLELKKRVKVEEPLGLIVFCGGLQPRKRKKAAELMKAGQIYAITKFAEGSLLGDIIWVMFPEKRKTKIVGDLGKWMSDFHKSGRVHGDVHPWNFIVPETELIYERRRLKPITLDPETIQNIGKWRERDKRHAFVAEIRKFMEKCKEIGLISGKREALEFAIEYFGNMYKENEAKKLISQFMKSNWAKKTFPF